MPDEKNVDVAYQIETPNQRAKRLGCYCGLWSKNPGTYTKQGIPQGFCGFCDICGKPGHIRHFPGSAPFTACWCETHYVRAAWLHPRGAYGCLTYGGLMVMIASTTFLIWVLF